jgi:hypothetical protein
MSGEAARGATLPPEIINDHLDIWSDPAMEMDLPNRGATLHYASTQTQNARYARRLVHPVLVKTLPNIHYTEQTMKKLIPFLCLVVISFICPKNFPRQFPQSGPIPQTSHFWR